MPRFHIDPELVEAAKLTPRQVEALERYDGRNYGYTRVAMELGISRETARGIVRAGLRKVEIATRPEQATVKRAPGRSSQATRAPGKESRSPAKRSKPKDPDVFDSSVFFDF